MLELPEALKASWCAHVWPLVSAVKPRKRSCPERVVTMSGECKGRVRLRARVGLGAELTLTLTLSRSLSLSLSLTLTRRAPLRE